MHILNLYLSINHLVITAMVLTQTVLLGHSLCPSVSQVSRVSAGLQSVLTFSRAGFLTVYSYCSKRGCIL